MIVKLDPVEAAASSALMRPRFEGANVGTWIGFKHVMYLAEEGVLQFLRDHGAPPGGLLKDHALGLEIVDSRLRLSKATDVDDLVRVEVRSKTKRGDRELTFGVTLTLEGPGGGAKLAGGTVKAVLRSAPGPARPPPAGLEPYVVPEVRRPAARADLPAELPHSPKVVGIFELCNWLDRKGVKNTSPMNKGGSQTIDDVRITMVHADHSCGILEEDGSIVYGGEACGYVLEFESGLKLYHAGDTNVFGDMHIIRELYSPEIVMLPIGDLFTMSPREASYACNLLHPKAVIPMHFGTFPPLTGRPQELLKVAQELGFELIEMVPGQSVGEKRLVSR
jgi:hypothetical protein